MDTQTIAAVVMFIVALVFAGIALDAARHAHKYLRTLEREASGTPPKK